MLTRKSGIDGAFLLSESRAKAAGTLDAGSSVGVIALSEPDSEGPICLLDLPGDSPLTRRKTSRTE